MAVRQLSTDELRRGMDTLPQELVDQIAVETFTAAADEVHVLELDDGLSATLRRHLNLLHVESSTRAFYAASYYGSGVFEIRCSKGYRSAVAWMRSIPQFHLSLISKIVLEVECAPSRLFYVGSNEKHLFLAFSLKQDREAAKKDFGPDVAAMISFKTEDITQNSICKVRIEPANGSPPSRFANP